MSTNLLSQQELYDIFRAEVESNAPDLTDWIEGSIDDVLGGAFSSGLREIELLVVDLFRKTFFDSADGPEDSGGPDDIQTLAVDHYGDAFSRPGATFSIGVVNFTRPTNAAGNVTILAGTVVKTKPDSQGIVQRFRTLVDVIMIGTSVNASCVAIAAGIAGNVPGGTPGSIVVIETALTDPTIVVSQAQDFEGGAPVMDTPTYRAFIRNLIVAIKGATIAAIEAKAKTVSGVVTANVAETEKIVIEYNPGTSSTVGSFFRIPYAVLYISDANGTANAALIQAVKTAIYPVRSAGVYIPIKAATSFVLNFTAVITLNPSGPNFAQLSADPSPITDLMRDYINSIDIGQGFSRASAEAFVLATYGAAGTNDLTAFVTTVPSGDVAPAAGVKLVPGAVLIGTV